MKRKIVFIFDTEDHFRQFHVITDEGRVALVVAGKEMASFNMEELKLLIKAHDILLDVDSIPSVREYFEGV